jgi:hypothetical protein
MRYLRHILLLGVLLGSVVDARKPHTPKKPPQKQESSKATDWVASWRTCTGDGAIKRDGSLWQFGDVGGSDWGQIYPIDSVTGEPTYTKKYIYHLKGRRIGSGFGGAKIINGSYRVYAIKRDGTLWGWGEGLRKKPIRLSHSHGWIDFRVSFEGNGCCAHDVGMQQNGSLWRFPENMNYTHKSPTPYLKMIGKQKGWDRVILNCCSIYATRNDGTLWQNDSLNAKEKFKKISYKTFCKSHPRLCKKLKKMPHRSLYSSWDNDILRVNTSGRAGMLWLDPEMIYQWK